MKRFLLSLAYLCCIAIPMAHAQEKNVVPLPPDLAELFKYNSTPVSTYTGIPQISYPIYEVNTGKISLPITLSYHASGIQVGQKATLVGLGWSLGAGGSIGRQIRGAKDETYPYGWFNNPISLDTISKLQYAKEMQQWYDGYFDPQPDFFDFNFTGKSGRFIWSKKLNSFVTTPYQPVNIKHIDSDNTYQITDDDGTRYFFTYPIQSTSDDMGLKVNIVGWNLTKIISADATDTVVISYTFDRTIGERGDLPVTSYSRLYHYNVNMDSDQGGYIYDDIQTNTSYTTVSQPRVSEITFRQGKVVFFANTPRVDYSGNALDSIVVFSKDNNIYNRVKKVAFTYDYYFNGSSTPFFADYKLKLQEFTKSDINGEQPETYRFGYDSTKLPGYGSCAIDWWGYYNGKNSQYTLMPAQSPNNATFPDRINAVNLGTADRNPDPAYMTAGILNKVTYPTGGYTNYSFSANKYLDNYSNDAIDTLVNLTLYGKSEEKFPPPDSVFTTFKASSHGASYSSIPLNILIIFSPKTPNEGDRNAVMKDLTTGNIVNSWSSTEVDPNKTDTLIWNQYNADTSHTYQIMMSTEDRSSVYIRTFITSKYSDSTFRYGAGIHVDSIASYDIDNTLQALDVYKYGDNENGMGYMPTPSKEVKENNFTYVETARMKAGDNLCQNIHFGGMYTYAAQSSYPSVTFQGANVIYDKVTKYSYNGSKPNGKTMYVYDKPDYTLITNPNNAVGYERIENSLSDEQMQLQSELIYRYNESDHTFKLIKKLENAYAEYNVSEDSAASMYKRRDVHFDVPCWDRPANDYQVIYYKIKSGGRRLLATGEYNYDDDSTVQSSIIRFTYNSKLYPQTISKLNSKNDTAITKILYPGDHLSSDVNAAVLNKMVYKNMLRQPYWQGNYINNNLLSYKHTLFGDDWAANDSLIAPNMDSAWQLGNDNSLPANTIAYQSYGKYGNIRQIRDDKGITAAYTWSTDGTYPLSQTAGAAINQVVYEGFEEPDTWAFGITRDATQFHTGKYAGLIKGSGSYTNTTWNNVSFTTATLYRYSGWIYSSGPAAGISLLMKKSGETAAYTYIDNVAMSESGKWVYVEKEFSVPSEVTSISLRLDNNGNGNVWFDDIKLRPSAAQMSTYSFNPMIGMSSKSDEGNHTLYYEFDGLNRLKLIRNKDRNILKMYCYNYAGEIDKCEGLVYYNTYQSQNYTVSCADGGSSTTITYGVDAGKYTSLISVADANNKALADIAAKGQAYANSMAICSYYLSHQLSDTFYRTTCGSNGTPQPVIYSIDEGIVKSYVSQDDANTKAKAKLDSLGKVYANANGKCKWINEIQTGSFQKTCTATGAEGTYYTYTVPAGKYYSYTGLDSANYYALRDLADTGKLYANQNGTCYFYSDAQTLVRTKVCDAGYKGSSVTYVLAARHDSSTVSKDAANVLAGQYAVAHAQDYANTNGTCTACNVTYTRKLGSGSLGIFNVSIKESSSGTAVYNKTFNDPSDSTLALCDIVTAGVIYTVTISSSSDSLYATVNGTEKGIAAGGSQSWTFGPSYNIVLSTKASIVYSSKAVTVSAQKTNCGGDSTGTYTSYTLAAGYYTSTTSQAYVDSLATVLANNNAKTNANQNGYCMPSGKNFGIVLAKGGTDPGTYQLKVTNSSGTTVVNIPTYDSGFPYYYTLASGSYQMTLSFMSNAAIVEVNGTVYNVAKEGTLSLSITPTTLIIVKKS